MECELSANHLRRLLGEDHGHVFTLIHKFRTEPRVLHPVLSERDDIIVLRDEAHRVVHHFLNRGYQGKAMVVLIDKLTTLQMHEKVRAEWEAEKARVLKALDGMAGGHPDFATLHARLVNL